MDTTTTLVNAASSPFDTIRYVKDNGIEYWSARDLQTLLGYTEWRKFEDAIERAKVACKNSGYDPKEQLVDAAKLSKRNNGAEISIKDYHLTRYGCYLVAMNGDPRKPEISAAQTYFAIRTRQAEIEKPMSTLDMLGLAYQVAKEHEQRLLQHDKQIAAVEAKAVEQQRIQEDQAERLEQQAKRIAAVEERTQERVFAYPDKKKAKKLSDMMYRIAETKVQCALEEDPESEESIGKHIEDLKDMVVAQISERLERDLRKELKQAQEYYIKKYIDAKSKDKSPAASVLRPAEARKLTLVAYVSSDPSLYSLVKNLLDDKEDGE